MYTKVFVSMMIVLGLLGILLAFILYFGFDPSYHPTLSVLLMSAAAVLTGGSFIGLLFLMVRKIYSRGFIHAISAFRSFRHGILIALFCVSLYIFHRYSILTIITGLLLVCIIFLLELILTKIEDA